MKLTADIGGKTCFSAIRTINRNNLIKPLINIFILNLLPIVFFSLCYLCLLACYFNFFLLFFLSFVLFLLM